MGKKVRIGFLFIVALVLAGGFFSVVYKNARYPVLYKAEILKSSYTNQIQPYVVASLISVESSYRKDVVSKKGAVGLMQLLPSTAKWIALQKGVENFDEEMLFDPQTNIDFGVFYLNYLMAKFKNLNNAICAYNAGEGTVDSWLKLETLSADGKTLDSIPFYETKNHLEKFKKALANYKNKYKSFTLEKLSKNKKYQSLMKYGF
jgi:soluble lytic murein transglycosylase